MSDVTNSTLIPVPSESISTETVPVPAKPAASPPAVKKIEKPRSVRYKLNLYTTSGTVKQSFSGASLHDAIKKYGDIIKSISSTRFMTLAEVCESIWIIEKKMRHPSNRSVKSIEMILQELIDRQMIVTD